MLSFGCLYWSFIFHNPNLREIQHSVLLQQPSPSSYFSNKFFRDLLVVYIFFFLNIFFLQRPFRSSSPRSCLPSFCPRFLRTPRCSTPLIEVAYFLVLFHKFFVLWWADILSIFGPRFEQIPEWSSSKIHRACMLFRYEIRQFEMPWNLNQLTQKIL